MVVVVAEGFDTDRIKSCTCHIIIHIIMAYSPRMSLRRFWLNPKILTEPTLTLALVLEKFPRKESVFIFCLAATTFSLSNLTHRLWLSG